MKCLAVLLLVVVSVALCAKPGATPVFLEGAPSAKVREFEDLLRQHHDKVDDEIHSEVWSWAKKQSPAIQKKFLDYIKLLEKVHEESEAAHLAAIEHFSAAAKAADARISAVAFSKTLTVRQKDEQINAIVKSLPKEVHQEIVTAMKG